MKDIKRKNEGKRKISASMLALIKFKMAVLLWLSLQAVCLKSLMKNAVSSVRGLYLKNLYTFHVSVYLSYLLWRNYYGTLPAWHQN